MKKIITILVVVLIIGSNLYAVNGYSIEDEGYKRQINISGVPIGVHLKDLARNSGKYVYASASEYLSNLTVSALSSISDTGKSITDFSLKGNSEMSFNANYGEFKVNYIFKFEYKSYCIELKSVTQILSNQNQVLTMFHDETDESLIAASIVSALANLQGYMEIWYY